MDFIKAAEPQSLPGRGYAKLVRTALDRIHVGRAVGQVEFGPIAVAVDLLGTDQKAVVATLVGGAQRPLGAVLAGAAILAATLAALEVEDAFERRRVAVVIVAIGGGVQNNAVAAER